MPDGLVLVGQDHLVRRVVEQVVKRLLLLDLVLDVVLPVVQSPEGIDGPLVLGPHLDIVPMLLHSARDRTSGAVRGERRARVEASRLLGRVRAHRRRGGGVSRGPFGGGVRNADKILESIFKLSPGVDRARARAWMAEGRRASEMSSLSPPYRDAPAGRQLGRHDEGNVPTIWHLRTPWAARAKGQ